MPPIFGHSPRPAGRFLIAACAFLALAAAVFAQGTPPSAAPLPENGLQKWLTDLDAQWRTQYRRDIDLSCDEEFEKLGAQYLATLDASLVKASRAGDLDAAIMWRTERDRFAAVRINPESDAAGDPAALKQARDGWRAQFARVEKDRLDRTKAFHARCDQVLSQAQTQLTQKQRFDDALLVKAERDALSSSWLGMPPAASAIAAAVPPAPATVAPPSVAKIDPPKPSAPTIPPREALAKLLALGGKVRISVGKERRAANTVSDAPEKCSIYDVHFRPQAGVALTAKELAILQEIPDLDGVGFHDLPLSDTDLQPLRTLRKLRFLEFDKLPNVTGTHLDFLAELQGLQDIRVSAMPANEGVLKALGEARSILYLFLQDMTVSDSGLASISRISGLKHLDMYRIEGFSVAGLAHLSKIDRLNRFTIDTPKLDAGMMSAIANMSVGNLYLKPSATLDEAGVIPLGKMTMVGSMTLINPPTTPAVLDALKKMSGLKNLNIGKKTPEATAEKLRAVLKGVTVKLEG